MEYNSTPYPMILYKIYDSIKLTKRFLFNRYPIKNNEENLSCKPFFIIGSGRSGNTLLRAVLCNHPEISIPPESYVLSKMVRKWEHLNFLEWDELVKIIVGELEAYDQFFTWEINLAGVYRKLMNLDEKTLTKIVDEIYCYYTKKKFPNASIWGDKTPLNTLNLGWIDKMFNNARYIHIIRDGRDVVSSYLKSGIYDEVEEASWRWNKSVNLARKYGNEKAASEYIEIRYENFVSKPSKVVKKICAFLDIQFQKEMLNHRKKLSKLGDVNKISHHNNLKKPINDSSIGKWKSNLSNNQKRKIKKLLDENLRKLGYK